MLSFLQVPGGVEQDSRWIVRCPVSAVHGECSGLRSLAPVPQLSSGEGPAQPSQKVKLSDFVASFSI